MSHGSFIVGAGAHGITGIQLAGNPDLPGTGFFIVTVTVPEPAPPLLIGVGLLMLMGMRRRV